MRQVEPRAGALFSIVRRAKKTVHQPLVGIRMFVIQECFGLRWGGRQSGEIQTEPTDQSVAISLGRWLNVFRLKPRQDEIVDRIARPGPIAYIGNWRTAERLKRPVRCFRIRSVTGHGGNLGALIDPGAQQFDLGWRQRCTDGRHAEALLCTGNALNQLARAAVARHNDIEQRIRHVHAQPLHLLLRAVTARAACGEDRLNIAIEIDSFGLRTAGENQAPDKKPHRLPECNS